MVKSGILSTGKENNVEGFERHDEEKRVQNKVCRGCKNPCRGEGL